MVPMILSGVRREVEVGGKLSHDAVLLLPDNALEAFRSACCIPKKQSPPSRQRVAVNEVVSRVSRVSRFTLRGWLGIRVGV